MQHRQIFGDLHRCLGFVGHTAVGGVVAQGQNRPQRIEVVFFFA